MSDHEFDLENHSDTPAVCCGCGVTVPPNCGHRCDGRPAPPPAEKPMSPHERAREIAARYYQPEFGDSARMRDSLILEITTALQRQREEDAPLTHTIECCAEVRHLRAEQEKLRADLAAAGIVDGKAPYYRADGTFEMVPISEWIEKRKFAAKLHAQTREREAALAAALDLVKQWWASVPAIIGDAYYQQRCVERENLRKQCVAAMQDPAAILSARDARRDPEILRRGVAWAYRDAAAEMTEDWAEKWLESRAAAIEAGTVEVRA